MQHPDNRAQTEKPKDVFENAMYMAPNGSRDSASLHISAGSDGSAAGLLLHALDDTEFVAGGLSFASSIQATMRFWLHHHNSLLQDVQRCMAVN